MKVLLQHPHRPGEISGVLTFVESAAAALQEAGCDVRILASLETRFSEIRDLVWWADVVHLNSHDLRCLWWSKVLGRPLIQHYHFPFWGSQDWSACGNGKLGFWGRLGWSLAVPWTHGKGWRRTGAFARYYSSSAGRVVLRVIAAMLADERLAVTQFVALDACLPCSVRVVYNPIDLQLLQTRPSVPCPDVPRFTFVGRLVHEKGPQLLVEAVALLRDAGFELEVVIVGDGSFRAVLDSRVIELRVQNMVRFTGALTRSEAIKIVCSSTAVVVPSLCDEASGYAVIEAAAVGRPVIASSRGGIPEIIGPGILLDDLSPVTLAAAMKSLALNQEEAHELGQRSREFALAHFHPHDVAAALMTIYQNVTR